MRFPGYEETFRTFAIRVELDLPLTGDATVAAGHLVEQMRAGRVYTAVDALANPVRFAYTGLTAGGRQVQMGERTLPEDGLILTAAAAGPPDATLRLLRNGRTVAQGTGPVLAHPVARDDEPGAYRVEVALPGAPGRPPVPWIVSNPIYVGAAAEAAPAPDRSVTSLPPPGDSWQVETPNRRRGNPDAGRQRVPVRVHPGEPRRHLRSRGPDVPSGCARRRRGVVVPRRSLAADASRPAAQA